MPRQNTLPADYPQAVLQQIEQLAQNIVIARKRRGETQAQWSKKLGVSQPTMVRIERGDPSVAMVSYVMCMWLINQAEGLANLISPLNDHAALEREVTKVRARSHMARPHSQKIRAPRKGVKSSIPKNSTEQVNINAAKPELLHYTTLSKSSIKPVTRRLEPRSLVSPSTYEESIHQVMHGINHSTFSTHFANSDKAIRQAIHGLSHGALSSPAYEEALRQASGLSHGALSNPAYEEALRQAISGIDQRATNNTAAGLAALLGKPGLKSK